VFHHLMKLQGLLDICQYFGHLHRIMYGASKTVIATHGQDKWPTSPTENKRRRKNEEDFEHILSVCLPYRKVKNRILKKSDKSVNNREE
jgi:hypothetical protein